MDSSIDCIISKSPYYNGLATIINKDGKVNIVDENNKLISPSLWFDSCNIHFIKGYARISIKKKYNIINTNGQILSKDWFDAILTISQNSNLLIVRNGNSFNYLTIDGKLLCDEWFVWIDSEPFIHKDYAWVKKSNGAFNIINDKGELLSNKWFDLAYIFKDGMAFVIIDKVGCIINTKGDVIFSGAKLNYYNCNYD